MQIEEMIAAQLADVVITHSPAEAALLRTRLPAIRIAVVPWSVPVRASTRRFDERNGIVFIGHFGHEPNVDAAHWLAREIVPLAHSTSGAGSLRQNLCSIPGRFLTKPCVRDVIICGPAPSCGRMAKRDFGARLA
jgi:hypothetical protein